MSANHLTAKEPHMFFGGMTKNYSEKIFFLFFLTKLSQANTLFVNNQS